MSVQRYKWDTPDSPMVKSHVGDFVAYADYGRLQDLVASLERQCRAEYQSGYKCGYGIAMTEKKTMEALCDLSTEDIAIPKGEE